MLWSHKSENEELRAALVELDLLCLRERATSFENATLLRVLNDMTRAGSSDNAAGILIDICAEVFGADAIALVGARGAAGISFNICDKQSLAGLSWDGASDLLHRPRRMVDLHKRDWGAPLPAALRPYHALLAMPLRVEGEVAMALLAMSETMARFSAADLHLLSRIAELAGQALASQRLVRRNSLLAAMIDGSVQSQPKREPFLDASLEAVSRAFDRLTHAQGVVVAINNELLRAETAQIDAAIQTALCRTGELAHADRVQVCRMSDMGQMINTHGWVADGIETMMTPLQDIPAELLEPWLEDFSRDREVYVPDVAGLSDGHPIKDVLAVQGVKSLLAVPMMRDGEVTGFSAYFSVREIRNFLPGEVLLLRSVGNTINAMLERRCADQRAALATSALLSERNRMQATLAAMPDLVLELDRKGNFTGYHSGQDQRVEAMARGLVGEEPDTALSRVNADIVWRVMREVDANGRTEGHEFRFDLPEGPRWFQVSAAARHGDATDSGYVLVIRDTTDSRAQSREILRLSEIARRTTNHVIVTDAAGRIEWVNHAFEQRTGWCLADIQGKKPGSFLQSEKSDKHTIGRIAAALRARVPLSAQILNVSRTGEEYWLELDIQPLFDTEGRHQGFMAVQSDITERLRQAERLQASTGLAIKAREQLVSAVEALQDGFALYDPDGRLLLCNQPYRDFFVHSGRLIREGMSYRDILHLRLEHMEFKAAIGREHAWLEQRMEQHHNSSNVVEQELADGRWVRSFEKATPDGGRVGLLVDITALKEAEQRALNERAAAMDASHDGIAITDPTGHFIYMNPAYHKMFGVPLHEDVRSLSWSRLFDQRQADWLRNAVFPILQRTGKWQGELTGCHRGGAGIEQEISLALQDDGGMVCITRDITERRRSDAERARLREELQLAQRREVIGQVATGLAHDFNNILAVISGSAGLIEARLSGTNADRQDARRIVEAANRAAALVTRLRDFGKKGSERVRLDLRKSLAEAEDLLRTVLPGIHKLVVHAPYAPLFAVADPTDILQVLLNLGINARDALDDGPNEIALRVTAMQEVDMHRPPDVGLLHEGVEYVVMRVEDTGPGIDPEIRSRIFEPYFTSKGNQGTGLGLAIVSGIVRSNAAALWFDSTPGTGTQVTVFWPVDQRPRAATGVMAPNPDKVRLDGLRVLIVDDEEEICAILTAILEAAGAEVATATEAYVALEAVTADPHHWHVLITDHDMPKLTGSLLAQAAAKVAPDLPVILVSALSDTVGDQVGLFKGTLPKPVDPIRLVSMVEKTVRMTVT